MNRSLDLKNDYFKMPGKKFLRVILYIWIFPVYFSPLMLDSHSNRAGYTEVSIGLPKIDLFTQSSRSSDPYAWKDIEIMILFSFSDFMCLSCLESFLNFIHSLPEWISSEIVWGVVAIEKDETDVPLERRIGAVEKKIRGFRTANGIIFPIFADRNFVFSDLAEQGSRVIVLDKQRQALKEFLFPLKKNEIKAIHVILGIETISNFKPSIQNSEHPPKNERIAA